MIIVHKMKNEGVDVYYGCDSFSISRDDKACKNKDGDSVPAHRIMAFKRFVDGSSVEVTPLSMSVVMPFDDIYILHDGGLCKVNKPTPQSK